MTSKDKDEQKRSEKKSESLLFSLFRKVKGGKSAHLDDMDNMDDMGELKEQEKKDEKNSEAPEPLLLLRQAWLKSFGTDNTDKNYESFLYSHLAPTEEETALLLRLSHDAELFLKKASSSSQTPDAQNATAHIFLSSDRLKAWCFLFPPLNGGEDITLQDFQDELSHIGICYGVEENRIKLMVDKKNYMLLAEIAKGDSPKDGENGRILEVIPSTVGKPFVATETKTIDFKDLNWLVHVDEKDVICKLVLPTEETPGKSVLNQVVHGKNGTKVVAPLGTNTVLSDDGLEVLAKVDGQVFFDNGKYRVTQMVTIDSDIDLSTGNLDVKGNLFIKGCVREGFSVIASGDISISGNVEGASVIAGGNIFIGNGMNGNSHGKIDAGGEIKCRYLENAYARATGCIIMDSIINSTVFSDDKIIVLSGRGVIIGGSLTAMNRIEAKVIGNQLERITTLILGRTPHFNEEKERLSAGYHKATDELKEIKEKIDALTDSELPSDQVKLKALQMKLSVARMREERFRQDLAVLTEKEDGLEDCQVITGVLYPVTQVSINGITKSFVNTYEHCRIYQSDSELKCGLK